MSTENFQPSDAMIRAAENLLMAKSVVVSLEPIVLSYQRAILATGQWSIRPEMAERLGDEWVLDPLDAYLLSDADRSVFQAQCNAARDEAGLVVKYPEECPLLVAKSAVVKAQNELIDAMKEQNKKTVDTLLLLGIDAYEQYVEECLQLLAPFVRNGLGDMAAPPKHNALAAEHSAGT